MYRDTEYVSEDILNDDLVKIFSPFHRLQTLLGVCRVDVRNKFVTPPTSLQKIYTCVILLLPIPLLHVMYNAYAQRLSDLIHLFNFMEVILFMEWIIFICNVFNSRFVNNDNNVDFFLRMHRVDSLMLIDKNQYIISVNYKKNRNSILAFVTSVAILYMIQLFEGLYLLLLSSFSIGYIQITYMLEFIHFSCIMYYFSLRMRFLNAIILNHMKDEFTLINFPMPDELLMKKSAAETHDFVHCNIDIFLKELIYCFYQFQNLYRYQIFLFFLRMFFSCICYMQFIIVAVNNNTLRSSNFLMVFLYVIDIILTILACTRCESFFREAKRTKHLSIVVLSMYHDGPLRKKAKRLLKILEENPPIFSVYHMWNVRHETLVQLCGVLTTAFFTLLQFHYL